MFTFMFICFFQVDGREVDDKIKLPEDSESDNSDKSKVASVSPSIVSSTPDSTRGSSDVAINPQLSANAKKDDKSSTEENKVEEPEEVNYREMLTG